MSEKVQLLCDAIPFCYGPAAALQTLLTELSTIPIIKTPIDVLASGTTKELLSKADLELRLLDIDSQSIKDLTKIKLSDYNVFLNVCNPISYDVLGKSNNIFTIYEDFLLWMNNGERKKYFDADLYLAENFPGTLDWKKKYSNKIRNLQLIPPLISTPRQNDFESGYLVIGLGGQISKLTKPGINTIYPTFVVSHLIKLIDTTNYQRVLVTGPESVMKSMKKKYNKIKKVSFASLAHNAFLRELSSCEAFLSHPGLYAPFEAMMAGIPTGFLPPSNYTQILQLRHFRKLGIANYSYSWEDTFKDKILENLSEAEGVAKVLDEVDRAVKNKAAINDFKKCVQKFGNLSSNDLKSLGVKQQKEVSKFGKNGAKVGTNKIMQSISKKLSLNLPHV